MSLADLNPEQKKAVEHTTGPLLIVAGAGTGKTKVITEKITYLVEKKLAKTEEILALTFTDKAAGEMEERVDRLLPYGYTDLWIMTFHSFCERVLKDHALDIGLSNHFKLLNQTEQWLLVRQNLDKFNLDYYQPLGNPTKFIHALIKHFSRCKDEEIWPENYLKYAEDLKLNSDATEIINLEIQKNLEIANAYHVYQQLLLDNEALDFGDLINYTLKLFRSRPNVLKIYQEQFKYVLVDEFQDTNFAQYELIKLLVQTQNLASVQNTNLTVVGDDDQSIYKFRGASVSNILQFKTDFPQAKEIYLTNNYRSTQNILDLAYNFIQFNNPERLEFKLNQTKSNKEKFSKKLIAHIKDTGTIEHLHFNTESDEVNGVINKILELYNLNKNLSAGASIGQDGAKVDKSWNDFAILIRANSQADVFVNGLRRAGLPYSFVASRGLYQKEIILDIFTYLKLLDNYHESLAFWRILNLPMINISITDLMEISRYASRKAISLFEASTEISLLKKVDKETVRKVNKIIALLKEHAILSQQKSVKVMILKFLEDFNYNQFLLQKNDLLSFEFINQLGKKIDAFEKSFDDKSVKNFINLINLELEAGEEGSLTKESEDSGETIKIMTVHASKGLEFKYVFIVNLVDKRFPSIDRSDPLEIPDALVKEIIPEGDVHLQEERRLFYVAITRAKLGLFLTSAEDYGGARKKKLSRFFEEIGMLPTGVIDLKENLKTAVNLTEINKLTASDLSLDIKNLSFSYSSLKAYETCPYQYYLGNIIKIPVPGKASFSYGKTMHLTLQNFFNLIKESQNASQADLFSPQNLNKKDKNKLPSLEILIKLFKDSWLDDWYDSKEQKETYKKLGEESLKNLYKSLETNGPPQIFALEKGFNFKLDKYTIKGVIDRIDVTNNGLALLDYKTGSTKTEKTVEKDQLLIYQLAAKEFFAEKIDQLIFYYLNNNTQVSFLGSAEELEKIKNKILNLIKEIETNNFAATPEKNKCKYCDFYSICQYRV